MSERVNFTSPVGRLVGGSCYRPNDKDADGKPLVVKSGANAGKPRVDFYMALAVPKGQERHWAETAFGQIIWAAGHKAFPGIAQNPAFAWKVTDGDSQVPNKKGTKPVDREGYRGHWVYHFGGGYAPKCYNKDGSAILPEPDAIKTGYYVQIAGSVSGNDSSQNPGVYLNHSMVSLQGYGPEISQGPDPTAAGFGAQPLPAGASAAPIGGFAVAAPAAPAAFPGGAPAVPPVSVPPPVAVAPHPGIMPAYNVNGSPMSSAPPVPGSPAAMLPPGPVVTTPPPMPPAAPVAPPARVMLPAANGHSYESLIAAGWNDATLRQHGMMQ